MRRALIVVVPLVVAAGLPLLVVTLPDSGAPGSERAPRVLSPRTVSAGPIEVTVAPVSVEGREAVFEVAFDTHSVELDLDVAGASSLEVGGIAWAPGTWEGDGPGGHHRAGRLSFAPGGPVSGDAHLTIRELPAPVHLQWMLGGG
ncbi:MAG TPA: hypothetical protein VF058_07505 [Actinomycetota bacterium]